MQQQQQQQGAGAQYWTPPAGVGLDALTATTTAAATATSLRTLSSAAAPRWQPDDNGKELTLNSQQTQTLAASASASSSSSSSASTSYTGDGVSYRTIAAATNRAAAIFPDTLAQKDMSAMNAMYPSPSTSPFPPTALPSSSSSSSSPFSPSPPPLPHSKPSPSRRVLPLRQRLLLACEACVDRGASIIGPILICACLFLISFVTYEYFVDVLPLLSARVCHGATSESLSLYSHRMQLRWEERDGVSGLLDERTGRFIQPDEQQPDKLNKLLESQAELVSSIRTDPCTSSISITLLGIYILFNILFHYFAAILKGPGRPPSHLSDDMCEYLRQYDPERWDDLPDPLRICGPCNRRVKPMRAHHCRVCKSCSLKFDHHCPWINTCVGWRNQRHFITFLFHLCLGCCFFLSASFDSAVSVLLGDSLAGGSYFLLAAILTFAATLACSCFMAWTVWLAATNQTTVDVLGKKWTKQPNPYDMGIKRNLSSVFGSFGLFLLVIPSLADPPGDGLIFPLNAGRGMPLPMLIDERTV